MTKSESEYAAARENIAKGRIWQGGCDLKVGGQAWWHENAGSFALTTRDLQAFVEFGFGKGYVARLGYRDVDCDEMAQNWDDYRAKITEVSVGYRW